MGGNDLVSSQHGNAPKDKCETFTVFFRYDECVTDALIYAAPRHNKAVTMSRC
jgi:hypothetical protein